jgi:hypothetical protein
MSLVFTDKSNDEQALVLADEIKEAFVTSKFWECEKLLGSGGYGVTMLLRDRDPLRLHNRRRVVLKRSIFPHSNDVNIMNLELLNEIDNLKVR